MQGANKLLDTRPGELPAANPASPEVVVEARNNSFSREPRRTDDSCQLQVSIDGVFGSTKRAETTRASQWVRKRALGFRR